MAKISKFIALAACLALIGTGCGEIVKTLTERAPATEAPEQIADDPGKTKKIKMMLGQEGTA